MRSVIWVCLGLVVLSACSPAESTTILPSSPIPILSPSPSPTATVTQETAEIIQPSPSSEVILLPSPSPAPTLTEWESVQQQVERLRNLLSRDSDGYAGLTLALEQDAPNSEWCAGLTAAIGDFNYVGDSESAQALERLRDSQGCP